MEAEIYTIISQLVPILFAVITYFLGKRIGKTMFYLRAIGYLFTAMSDGKLTSSEMETLVEMLREVDST